MLDESRNVTSYIEYVTQAGDTFDQLAYEMYDDELMADVIAEFNPDCAGTIVFEAGILLYIPVFDEENEEGESLPPWRRGEEE